MLCVFNTSFNVYIEPLYARDSPPIIKGGTFPLYVEAINNMLEERDNVLDQLQKNLTIGE